LIEREKFALYPMVQIRKEFEMSNDIVVGLFRIVLTVAVIQQTLKFTCTDNVAAKFRLYFGAFSIACAVVIFIDFLQPKNVSPITILEINGLLFLYGAAASILATRKIKPLFDSLDAGLAIISTAVTAVVMAWTALNHHANVAVAIGALFAYAIIAPVAVMFATNNLRSR
jgi:hypothetical protein